MLPKARVWPISFLRIRSGWSGVKWRTSAMHRGSPKGSTGVYFLKKLDNMPHHGEVSGGDHAGNRVAGLPWRTGLTLAGPRRARCRRMAWALGHAHGQKRAAGSATHGEPDRRCKRPPLLSLLSVPCGVAGARGPRSTDTARGFNAFTLPSRYLDRRPRRSRSRKHPPSARVRFH